MIDFNKVHIELAAKVKFYIDLSPTGDYIEANQNVYDYLRQSETQEEGQFVLITNIENAQDHEMKASLFDRLFRAVTGT